jgi:hypothetical protein
MIVLQYVMLFNTVLAVLVCTSLHTEMNIRFLPLSLPTFWRVRTPK